MFFFVNRSEQYLEIYFLVISWTRHRCLCGQKCFDFCWSTLEWKPQKTNQKVDLHQGDILKFEWLNWSKLYLWTSFWRKKVRKKRSFRHFFKNLVGTATRQYTLLLLQINFKHFKCQKARIKPATSHSSSRYQLYFSLKYLLFSGATRACRWSANSIRWHRI